MNDHFPPGALDAVIEPIHRMVCASMYPGDENVHTWREHSGTGYKDYAHEFMQSLNDAGFTVTRRKT